MRGGVIVQDDQDYSNWESEQETFQEYIAKQNLLNEEKKLAKK